ncbi:MAG: adenylyl-sulfate kinase [Proteobacteria bacterium]|nr:MAG: adenylyl-sulfate kinase [Pseudomonadota bacterium]
MLRFSTAGSVDDGKSTLIGRLLHDTGNIYLDHLDALKKKSEKSEGPGKLSLALLTDGLKAEQEQGITIDVAYRYFSTPKRWFILADSPGHEQYTRNMATAASTADLTIILIDARKGVITQTKRHTFIASLLGVPRLLVTVNKMDLVNFSEEVFNQIKDDFTEFASKLGIKEIRFVPISALLGDNVVEGSTSMPWYHGETVMDYLENVYIAGDLNQVDFRFPVQYVLRPNQNYRGYAGQISSGQIRIGEEITVLPGMRKSRIKSIDVDSRDPNARRLEAACAPMSVVLTLEHEIDVSRGDMIARSLNLPPVRTQFEAMLVWMNEEQMDPDAPYLILQNSRETKAYVDQIKYKIDVNTVSRESGAALSLNEVGRVVFTTAKPMMLDAYKNNRATGGFILVNPRTNQTAAAGMVIDRLPAEMLYEQSHGIESKAGETKAKDLHIDTSLVSREERSRLYGFKALTVWCTGLSGSGKSSITKALERQLFNSNVPVFRLDGDSLRHGLNRDLGFSERDRSENIRRAAEVAKLFNDAGVTVLCSFISPIKKDREEARRIIGSDNFIEVHLSTPLEVCEKRDPHNLYKKARSGEIKNFTGISAPYEPPDRAEVVLDSSKDSLQECVENLLDYVRSRRK